MTVSSHKARSTGTIVNIIDNRDESYEAHEGDPNLRWVTECEDHGCYVCHSSRKAATAWAAHPEDWCEGGCMS